MLLPSKDMLGAVPQSMLTIQAIIVAQTIGIRGAYSVVPTISISGASVLFLNNRSIRSAGMIMMPSPALRVYVGMETNLFPSIFHIAKYWLLFFPVSPLYFTFTLPLFVVIIFLKDMDKM